MGFSDLKRSTGIESSGLVSFHLRKLEQLVVLTREGVYALTDQGKEALRMVSITRGEPGGQTVRVRSGGNRRYLAVIIVLLLALASVSTIAVYRQYGPEGPNANTIPSTTSSNSIRSSTTMLSTSVTSSAQSAQTVIVTGYLALNFSGLPPSRLEWVNFTASPAGNAALSDSYSAVANPAGQYWIKLPANEIIQGVSVSWRSLTRCAQQCSPVRAGNSTCHSLLNCPWDWNGIDWTGYTNQTSQTAFADGGGYLFVMGGGYRYQTPQTGSVFSTGFGTGYTNQTSQTGYATGGCGSVETGMYVGRDLPVVILNLICP
jgi:hypothetical protein